jgi:hypothetical protein
LIKITSPVGFLLAHLKNISNPLDISVPDAQLGVSIPDSRDLFSFAQEEPSHLTVSYFLTGLEGY